MILYDTVALKIQIPQVVIKMSWITVTSQDLA